MVKCQLQQDKKPIGLIIKLFVADGEYIVGNLNELYQFRILGDARMEGSNAVYKVELGGGNTQGVPAERLLSGERFSVEAAFVEDELSRSVGDKLKTYVTSQLIAA